jgi:hypothetical protein
MRPMANQASHNEFHQRQKSFVPQTRTSVAVPGFGYFRRLKLIIFKKAFRL